MGNIIAKLKSRDSLIFFSLTAICFAANFLRLRSFGVYGDDWSAGTYLYNNSFLGAVKQWIIWPGELANFRPLAIILPILWYWAYALFKIAGVYLVIGGFYSVMFFLGYKVLSQRVSVFTAYLASVVFILYPTNNFFVWQVATTYPMGLILVFAAVLNYWKQRRAAAFVLLLCSALANEGLLFLFALALLPKEKITWSELKRDIWPWAKFMSGLVLLYTMVRAGFELSGFTRGSRLVEAAHTFNIVSYLTQFFKAIFVELLLSWGFAGWKILHAFSFSHLAVAIVIIAIAFGTVWLLMRKGETAVPSPLPYWYLLIAGLVLICAGRYYGFFYVPSINVLNLDSRYYFASSVGSFVFVAGIIEMSLRQKFFKWKYLSAGILCLAIFFLALFKYEIQLDGVNAWTGSKNLLGQMFTQIPALHKGEAVIINMPARVLGDVVETSQAVPDLRLFFPIVYGPGTSGFLSAYIQSQSNTSAGLCLNLTSVAANYCINKADLYIFTWNGQSLIPHGNSPSLQNRPTAQNIPNYLKLELAK